MRAGRSAVEGYRKNRWTSRQEQQEKGKGEKGDKTTQTAVELPPLHHRMLFSIFQAMRAVDAVVYDVTLMIEGPVMRGQGVGALVPKRGCYCLRRRYPCGGCWG